MRELTDTITIPPEVIDAMIAAAWETGGVVYEEQARDMALALLRKWPGADKTSEYGRTEIILPLPKEPSDDK
jgi:hypothetical protein